MGKSLKLHTTLVVTALFFALTIGAYILFLRSSHFDSFYSWSQKNLLVYCLVLFVLKICAIVYAPLPGGLLSLGSIPILGWKLTYVVDFLGSLVGGSLAYYIGKRYGLSFMRHIFDHSTIERIQKIKMNAHREAEGVFVLRILTGSSLLDAICYAAGFLGIKYRNFLLGSVLSHVVVGLPAFYLSDNLFRLNLQNIGLNIVGLVIPLLIVYRLRHRYFYTQSPSETSPS